MPRKGKDQTGTKETKGKRKSVRPGSQVPSAGGIVNFTGRGNEKSVSSFGRKRSAQEHYPISKSLKAPRLESIGNKNRLRRPESFGSPLFADNTAANKKRRISDGTDKAEVINLCGGLGEESIPVRASSFTKESGARKFKGTASNIRQSPETKDVEVDATKIDARDKSDQSHHDIDLNASKTVDDSFLQRIINRKSCVDESSSESKVVIVESGIEVENISNCNTNVPAVHSKPPCIEREVQIELPNNYGDQDSEFN